MSDLCCVQPICLRIRCRRSRAQRAHETDTTCTRTTSHTQTISNIYVIIIGSCCYGCFCIVLLGCVLSPFCLAARVTVIPPNTPAEMTHNAKPNEKERNKQRNTGTTVNNTRHTHNNIPTPHNNTRRTHKQGNIDGTHNIPVEWFVFLLLRVPSRVSRLTFTILATQTAREWYTGTPTHKCSYPANTPM